MFNLSIESPGGVLFRGEAQSLVVPCADGLLGILQDHAPLIALVVPGPCTVKSGRETRRFPFATGGFLDVRDNTVTVLLKEV